MMKNFYAKDLNTGASSRGATLVKDGARKFVKYGLLMVL